MAEGALLDLFGFYRLNYSNSLMTSEQNLNLKMWHERKGRTGITLSQVDQWMMQAGMIKKKVLSVTDTGKTFSKFKKFSISEAQFMEYLEMLSKDKNLDLEDMMLKLSSAGVPKVKDNDDDEFT